MQVRNKRCFVLYTLLSENVCLNRYTGYDDNFGWAAYLSWLERRVSDCKIACSMPVLDINDNYLTGTLCGRLAQISVSQRHIPKKKKK